MNKMVHLKQKALLVISLITLSSLSILCSCSTTNVVTNKDKYDYDILNSILETSKNIEPAKKVYLLKSYPNDYVLEIIKSQKNKKTSSNDSIFSGYGFIDIEIDETLQKIFNEKEYDFLLSQNATSNWDNNKISKETIVYEKNETGQNSIMYKISKPIYTIDNKFALIGINKQSWEGIIVMQKKEEKWIEYKLIAPLIIQQKAKLKN